MSGPPLDPTKTASGIVIDPQTLERVVPNTKRKDGTVRKELKIRPGYTPTEDVARYRSTGQRDAARLKGYVPGASSATSSTYLPPSMTSDADFPSLSKSARKNLNRRLKKGKEELDKEEADAEDWDARDGDEDGHADEAVQAMQGLSLEEQAKRTKEEEEAKGKASLRRAPRPGGGLFRELGIKSKEKEQEGDGSTVDDPTEASNLIESSPDDKPPAQASPYSPEDAPPPTLAPPIVPTPAAPATTSSPKPKPKPPKSLLPASLLAPSPSTTPKPASASNKSSGKTIPGASATSSSKANPTNGANSARTRTEPKTRPGFSPMGQINGLLGGGSSSRANKA